MRESKTRKSAAAAAKKAKKAEKVSRNGFYDVLNNNIEEETHKKKDKTKMGKTVEMQRVFKCLRGERERERERESQRGRKGKQTKDRRKQKQKQ